MIVRFDATIEDLVDVSMRSWANSKNARLWRWQGAAATGLIIAIPAYFLTNGRPGVRLTIACAVAVVGAAFYLSTYRDSVRKRVRKLCRAQIGTDAPFTVTVELLDEGISFTQMDARILHGWSRIERVEEEADALYFFYKDNSCSAVRKRAFESAAMKDEFLTRAEAYIQKSRGPF